MATHGAGLLTVRQVAAILAIQEGTVRAWLTQRRLPRVKCGRAVRIPAAAVEDFIQKNTVPCRDVVCDDAHRQGGRKGQT
jgi:excisionase family DNA binding protein